MRKSSYWRKNKALILACLFSVVVVGLELAAACLEKDERQKSVIADLSAPAIDALVFAALFIAARQSRSHSKRLALALVAALPGNVLLCTRRWPVGDH